MGAFCCGLQGPNGGLCTPEGGNPDVRGSGGYDAAFGSRESILSVIAKVGLFRRLEMAEHIALEACCIQEEYAPGATLIRQGDSGQDLFIIIGGSVSVFVDGKLVAKLTPGDYFGEASLLTEEPRNATICASSEQAAKVLKITKADFRRLGLPNKIELPKRQAVMDGGSLAVAKPPSPKTPPERQLMKQALLNNINLQEVVKLTDRQCDGMIDVAWKEKVAMGMKLIEKGDPEGQFFYIVQSGSFVVDLYNESELTHIRHALAGDLHPINPGGSFGELALLYSAPRAATIRACENSVVWVIARAQFKTILADKEESDAKWYRTYLDGVEAFKNVTDDKKLEIAKALRQMNHKKEETILEQGETGDRFYILIEGDVTITKDGKQVAQLKGTKDKPQFFGERALLQNDVRAATVRVSSPSAKTLSLDKTSFDMLLSKLETLIATTHKVDTSRPRILRAELTLLGLLGCGGFGAVSLVHRKATNEIFALKQLSKGHLVQTKMQKSIKRERDIQLMCDSIFIIKLYDTYNEDQYLSLLLEVALGGELYEAYQRKGLHGSIKHAQFYLGSVLFGFDHMHERYIIYRDLKPENLLLTDKGQMKITDMGLAKVSVGKTHTTCGTPDYFAPEVISGEGHTVAVDWWCLGVLAYELVVGKSPFFAPGAMLIYRKVQEGIDKVVFPARLGPDWKDLVCSLCQASPADRLPMTKGGSENIKKHKWYKGFNWKGLGTQSLTPPYVPKVKTLTDTSNFYANEADLPPKPKYVNDNTGWDEEFATST